MKLEQLIAHYLYQHKQMSLQDIGHFSLNGEVVLPAEGSDKEVVLQPNAISFIYDKKAPLDEGLIQYIVDKTRKIRPLATSDLESFIQLNKQVLNIGKALELEGLGTLQKMQNGEYQFFQGNTFKIKSEVPGPVEIKEKINKDISFSDENPGKANRKVWMVPVIGLLLAGLAALAYFMFKDQIIANFNQATTDTVSTRQTALDTTKANTLDTLKRDSLTVIAPPVATDSNKFSMIIETHKNMAAAQKRLATLHSYGHPSIKIVTVDSTRIDLVMPFKNELYDTVLVKDSIRKIWPKAYLKLP